MNKFSYENEKKKKNQTYDQIIFKAYLNTLFIIIIFIIQCKPQKVQDHKKIITVSSNIKTNVNMKYIF